LAQAGQASHGHADAPGAVQKLLAGFLKRCPQGVIVLEDVQKLHPRLLPVFINALSEHGHFEVMLHSSIALYHGLTSPRLSILPGGADFCSRSKVLL
jgi:hypothetical protein